MAKGFSKRATRADKPKVAPNTKKFPATEEQQTALAMAIKESVVKVQAPAGSGKSTTIFYIGEHISDKSIYLAYNKTMAMEAKDKCEEKGLSHIACMTTHSLAYQVFGKQLHSKLSRPRGRYVNVAGTPTEISKYYKLSSYPASGGKTLTKAFVGLIVRDTCNRFEMSKGYTLDEKCIPRIHLDDVKKKGIANIKRFISMIVRKSTSLWEDRQDTSSQVLATHNTYLKMYQLSKPDLSRFKVIYLDEAQDLNPVTHDIVMQQEGRCKIILVGDMYQSIYQFNGSRNYLKTMKCPQTWLSKSFRFGSKVADIAKCILGYSIDLIGNENIDSVVGGYDENVVDKSKPYTILYRTNMTLILDALDLLTKGESINISIDVKDFIKLLQSCQALHDGDMRNVKHDSILPYEDWEEIVEDAKNIAEVKRVVKFVEGGETDHIISTLTKYRPKGNEKVTLVTAHKSKGMEYPQVMLADDFPSNYNDKGEWVGVSDEERNLLYVAATRGINALQYNTPVREHIEFQHMEESIATKSSTVIKSDTPPYCPEMDDHNTDPDMDTVEDNTSFESVTERQKICIDSFLSKEVSAMMKSIDLPLK